MNKIDFNKLICDLVSSDTNEKISRLLKDALKKQGLKVVNGKLVDFHKSVFGINDWIVRSLSFAYERKVAKVCDFDGENYRIIDTDGNSGVSSQKFIEDNFHKWTFDDIRSGDILRTETAFYTYIFEFKSCDVEKIFVKHYIKISKGSNPFVEYVNDSENAFCNVSNDIRPAKFEEAEILRSYKDRSMS